MKKTKLVSAIIVVGMLSACGHVGKQSVYFEPGSAQLSQAGKNSLKRIAQMAKPKLQAESKVSKSERIHLTGFADNAGSKKFNKKISERRVLAVKQELMKLGINPTYISSSARGEGWIGLDGADQSDRRVDVLVY